MVAPALGEGRAVSSALNSLAQQPAASSTITRTLFVGLAMIESIANTLQTQSVDAVMDLIRNTRA